jgi:hypothetical protein
MERELKERLAANEDTFREINEGIARGLWPGEPSRGVSFRCECARLGCNLLLELSLPEYEAVRQHARRFIVAPGHELPGVEDVVEQRENYRVVQKRGVAGIEAERLDSRS